MQLLMTALLFGGAAVAQDGEEFDFIKPDSSAEEDKPAAEDFGLFDDEEDFEIAVPEPPPPEPAAALALEASGAPLTDSYPAAVQPAAGSVVIELPVLLSRTAADVSESYWLSASLWDGERELGESWLSVTPAGVPGAAPGFAFFKLQAPVAAPGGSLELRVARASAPGGEGEELFRKAITY